MPPAKKKLSAEDEKLVQDVKDELEKPADLPDDDQDTDTDKNAPETESSQLEGDGEKDGASAVEDESGEADSDADLVWTESPCAICFPEGWPTEEDGAHVNCPHGHAIAYGQRVQITKERALELGFVEHKPE